MINTIVELHPAHQSASAVVDASYQDAFKSVHDALNLAHGMEISDITGRLCELFPLQRDGDDAIPMYSYSRPAYVLWQGVFEELVKSGWTEEDAIAWLQSKGPRHMLDVKLSDMLAVVARWVARNADRRYIE